MQPSRSIDRLVEIMRALRTPDTGCPWDLEQTFDTIVPYTIEETHEVVDAIERRDPEDLREELGDLLLQVVYYAQLASEADLFAFEDVVETVTRKMIRRHPHVFGDEAARTARSAKDQWERIKAEEKRERAEARRSRSASKPAGNGTKAAEWMSVDADVDQARSGLLDAIPGSFPAVLLARKLQEKAASVGFDWKEPEPIIAKMREETDEFAQAVRDADPQARFEELGDLLFTAVNLGRRFEIDPDAALRATCLKFRSRFAAMEAACGPEGLASLGLDEQEALWVRAKSASGQG